MVDRGGVIGNTAGFGPVEWRFEPSPRCVWTHVAQLVERRPVKATIAGSNPAVGVRPASEKRRVALTTEAASGGAIRRKLGLWCNGNIPLLQSGDQGSSPCRSKHVRVARFALVATRAALGLSSNLDRTPPCEGGDGGSSPPGPVCSVRTLMASELIVAQLMRVRFPPDTLWMSDLGWRISEGAKPFSSYEAAASISPKCF